MAKNPWAGQPADTRLYGAVEFYLAHYPFGTVVRTPMAGHAEANDMRMSWNRAARHYGFSPQAWVEDQGGEQCYLDCADPAAPHRVAVALQPKRSGQGYVAEQSGGDLAKLKYNPFLRGHARRVQMPQP